MNWKSFCLYLLKMAYQYFGKKICVCLCVVCIVCAVCVHGFLCGMCACVCVLWVCTHMHLEARDHHPVSSPISLPLIYLRQCLSLVWGSLSLLDWLARWLHPSPPLQCWDYWYTAPAFWRGLGDTNSGPHAYMLSTLLTGSSLALLLKNLNYISLSDDWSVGFLSLQISLQILGRPFYLRF